MESSDIMARVSQQPGFQLAQKVGDLLRNNGFETWLAGGAVRDILLGRIPHDFDLATAATPEQVENLFDTTVAVGKQFGVIVVVEGELQVEVATFRKDGGYQDGRRPNQVEFAAAKEDAERRDFTINALFMDWQSGKILDLVAGKKDLERRLIRAVGVPTTRFQEDHLRILRALRFQSQLGFDVEAETMKAIAASTKLLRTLSRERIREELGKLVQGQFVHKILMMFEQLKLIEDLFPETPGLCFESKRWKDAETLFADAWTVFFLVMHQSGSSLASLQSALLGLRGARIWSEQILKRLFWFTHPRAFAQMRIGEMIDLSFDPEVYLGLLAWLSIEQTHELAEKHKAFRQLRPELKPEPLVKAGDLKDLFSGPRLGQALREAYWLQLESAFTPGLKSELLDRVRSQE